MVKKFKVMGMGCSACVARVEKAVNALSNVNSVSVSLIENAMTVDFDENKLSVEEIVKAVVDAGYEASLDEDKEALDEKKKS